MGLKNTYQTRKRFTKVPVDKTGMWYQDGDVVVPSNQITMKGPNGEPNYFNSPILGTGMQSGQTQVMYPGREYSFPNDNSVYERKMQSGGETSTFLNPDKIDPVYIKYKRSPDETFVRGVGLVLDKLGLPAFLKLKDDNKNSEFPIKNRESIYKYKVDPNKFDFGDAGKAYFDAITTGDPEIDYRRKENAALIFEENPVVSDAYQTNKVWNYYKDYMSSPRYAEMLQGKKERDDIEINRAKNLQKIQSIPNYDNIPGVGGYYKPNSNQISLNPAVNNRFFTLNEIIPHELSHSTDFVGNLIPNEDLKNIKNKLKPKSEINLSSTVDFWKNYGDNPKEGTINYFSNPTEVRARLNTIRYNLYNKGVDIFNKPIKKEDLNNLNIQNLNELKSIYKDDDILWLLNNISKTNNKTDSIQQMAKYGASMTDSQKSGLKMSYLKTKRFK